MLCTITEAKKSLNGLVTAKETVYITTDGVPAAALVPYEEYQQMYRFWKKQQDLEALAAIEQYKKGMGKVFSQKDAQTLIEGKV